MLGNISVDWLYIIDASGSLLSWSRLCNCGSISWNYTNIFSCKLTSKLFTLLFSHEYGTITSNVASSMVEAKFDEMNPSGFNSMGIPYVCDSIIYWIIEMVSIIGILDKKYSEFALATLWFPSTFITCDLIIALQDIPDIWSSSMRTMNRVKFVDTICAAMICIHLVKDAYSDKICNTSDTDTIQMIAWVMYNTSENNMILLWIVILSHYLMISLHLVLYRHVSTYHPIMQLHTLIHRIRLVWSLLCYTPYTLLQNQTTTCNIVSLEEGLTYLFKIKTVDGILDPLFVGDPSVLLHWYIIT